MNLWRNILEVLFILPPHTLIRTSMGLSMIDCGNITIINMVMNALQQKLKGRGKNIKGSTHALSSSMLAEN
jgi:hypothetical protein